MRILLLGATGRTGRLALDYALAQGHDVVALVRNRARVEVESSHLTVVEGTPEKPEDVAQAIPGCEAVVVALNNNRESDLPWAKPVSPPHLMEDSVRNCVEAMRLNGIKRIVVVSSVGVGDSFPDVVWLFRLLIKRTNLRHTFADHDAVDAYLHGVSDVDWTLVRAVGLTNADKVKDKLVITYANQPKPALMISRKHVAKFMIDSIGDRALFGKAPVISER